MKTTNEILANISADKDLTKKIKSIGYFDADDFIRNAHRYISASRENRIFCIIYSVSSSGMSRVLNFYECSQNENKRMNYYNFYSLFKSLGHTETKRGFRVSGCGMDMIFHTHYCIIHKLFSLGFIDKSECENLSQNTPPSF